MEILLDSWDRQSKIINDLATLINDQNRHLKPSEDGMSLDEQLCHIHEVRYGWLGKASPEHQKNIGDVLKKIGDDWKPIENLDEIRTQLKISAKAIRDATEEGLKKGGSMGCYENPILLMQHMVWHEGWHAGLIILGLRLGGQAPDDYWEEDHLWIPWRGIEEWE